jgi:hypothetical protein
MSSATSSDTNSFTATIQGNNLVITPVAHNTAPVNITVILADTNGNASYLSFQVSSSKLRQTLYFPVNETPYSTAGYTFNNYSDAAYADYPSSSVGLGVGATVMSGPAYVTNGQLHFKGTGVVTLEATQGGNFFYPSASTTGYIIVDRATQSLTSFPSIPNQTNFTNSYNLTLASLPTSSAGLPVSITTTGSVKLTGKSLLISGAGTVTLTAKQPGDANYYSATPVTQSFTVTPKPTTP